MKLYTNLPPPAKEDIKEEREIFNELWAILKRFYFIENQDEIWESLIRETTETYNKHKCQLAKGMILAIINHLEKLSKNRQNQN